jgi:hypothetical protein
MDRFLKLAGIKESRRVILGSNSSEVFGYMDTIKRLMDDHPEDKFLLIVDENLDIVDGGACHQTVSGSLSVQTLISELDEKTEQRLLALIRSVNDSDSDIEQYVARAHGFLLKEPIKKDGILDLVKPFWSKRFPSIDGSNERSSHMVENDLDVYGPSTEDIREAVRVIEALAAIGSETVLQRRWSTIRAKLHALKGDLMTMVSKDKLAQVLGEIDAILSWSRLPHDFPEKWAALKLEVETII